MGYWDRELIVAGNQAIRIGDLAGLQELYDSWVGTEAKENQYNLPLVFEKWMANCCLYGNLEIAQWLWKRIFVKFDVITRIALKPVFFHGRFQARAKKHRKLVRWLNSIFEQIVSRDLGR